MKIQYYIKKDTNKYIVLPKIQKFCKENELGSINHRGEGIRKIEEYADSSTEAREKVNIWIDNCVKEGIKHIYFTQVEFNKNEPMYKTEIFWKKFSKDYIKDEKEHINEFSYINKLKYGNLKLEYNKNEIDKVSLCMSLLTYDVTNSYEHPNKEGFLIFIDLYINKKLVAIRLKSKSKLYEVVERQEQEIVVDLSKKIITEKLAVEVLKKLESDIGFKVIDKDYFNDKVQNVYYKLLSDLTKTPKVIEDKIEELNKSNEDYIKQIIENTNINEIYYSDLLKKDLNIMLEKFISISYVDKEIFKHSFAYPIKLSATDSEDTKVEETASGYESLQTKGAFYDHKKIFNEEKKCDGMTLAAYRKNTIYYGKVPYIVKLDILETKGLGRIRFIEYIEEEDIQNVLSRIISNL